MNIKAKTKKTKLRVRAAKIVLCLPPEEMMFLENGAERAGKKLSEFIYDAAEKEAMRLHEEACVRIDAIIAKGKAENPHLFGLPVVTDDSLPELTPETLAVGKPGSIGKKSRKR